jgi:hypothetical protein
MIGIGLTNNVREKAPPAPQGLDDGMTEKTAVWVTLLVCDNVPIMEDAGPPAPLPDKVPVSSGDDQVYCVLAGTIPLVPLIADKLNADPLQTTREKLVMDTTGLTQTVMEKTVPVQSPDKGVTR